jgi:hypothetical protein
VLLDPVVESIPVPPADAKAFPFLKVHVGHGCTHCPAVSKREDEIRKHYNACHASVRRGRGGAVANSRGMMRKRLDREHYGDQPPYLPAFYQRFFTAGVKGSICFQVKAPEIQTQGAISPGQGALSRSDEGQFVMDQIFGTLARLETAQSHDALIPNAALTKTQVSPWLERTRWLHYLKGVPLDRATGLARLEPDICVFSCRSIETLKKHRRDIHDWRVVGTRGGSRTKATQGTFAQRHADAWKPVHCPRFFAIGRNAGYVVFFMSRVEENQVSQRFEPAPFALATVVLQILAMLVQAEHGRAEVVRETSSTKEMSPWLQLTRWSSYLGGRHIPSVAALLNRELEPTLVALCDSLERIVKDAHASVLSDRINAFDQVHINSFLHQPYTIDRPLMVKLRKPTWKLYTRI